MNAQNAARTADSTDRIAALTTSSPANPVVTPKTNVARFSGATRLLLGALMRSLATPHI